MSHFQPSVPDPTRPDVSVVVPFHDTRRYLDEAVRSVLAQTFTSWELVLVDDGGTDGSDAIAHEHARRDPRIRVVQHPGRANRGISAARNLGLREARGRLVAQFDSDDVLLPFHLEQHVAALAEHPEAALVYGPTQRWYSWRDDAGPADDFVALPLERYDRLLPPPSLLPILLQRPYGVPSGFVWRRAVLPDVGGFEDEFRGVYDDQVFFVKLALRHPVYALGRWSYRYRRHPGSTVAVTNAGDERLAHRLRFLEWVEGYLTRERVTDRAVWKAVRQELWKCRHPDAARRRDRIADLARRVRGRIDRALG